MSRPKPDTAFPSIRTLQDTFGSVFPQTFLGGWLAVAAGLPVAVLTLAGTGVGVALGSVVPLVGLLGLLITAQVVYVRFRPNKAIGETCGMLAVLIAAALLAAVISHAGLRFGAAHIDETLSRADSALGIHAPKIVLYFARYPSFAEWLGALYNTTLPVCFVCGLILAARENSARAGEFAFCFVFCILLAATVSIGLPALGSMVHHGVGNVVGLPPAAGIFHMEVVEYYRHDPLAVFDLARLEGIVTFPSFHMVMALLVPFALRGMKWPGIIAMIWGLLVTLSAVVIGGHYVVDLIAGAIVWAVSAWLAQSTLPKAEASDPAIIAPDPVSRHCPARQIF